MFDEDGNTGGTAAFRWVDYESEDDDAEGDADESNAAGVVALVAVGTALVGVGVAAALGTQYLINKVRSSRLEKRQAKEEADALERAEAQKAADVDTQDSAQQPELENPDFADFAVQDELVKSVEDLLAEPLETSSESETTDTHRDRQIVNVHEYEFEDDGEQFRMRSSRSV
ncbi:hypothetical protein ACFSYH_00635 [Populibacterium corticicola]|uniref:Transmembrane protein n=1 Tax=Populibacterium corticicola TaxID=1812826 RepID=A0ABW5XC25_9MICO